MSKGIFSGGGVEGGLRDGAGWVVRTGFEPWLKITCTPREKKLYEHDCGVMDSLCIYIQLRQTTQAHSSGYLDNYEKPLHCSVLKNYKYSSTISAPFLHDVTHSLAMILFFPRIISLFNWGKITTFNVIPSFVSYTSHAS